MRADERRAAVGVFAEREQARDAVNALKDAGFESNQISMLMPHPDSDVAGGRLETSAGEGAVAGAVVGGLFGGLWGWLAGISALLIPGVGPFVAAGAFAAALTGAAIGAGLGAIAGALIGLGVPKEEAEWYEGELRGGRTLVAVAADGRYSEARDILRGHGAYDVEMRDSVPTGTVSPATSATSDRATERVTTSAEPGRPVQRTSAEVRTSGERDRAGSAPAGGDTPTGAGIPFGHEDEPHQAHVSPTSPEYPVEHQREDVRTPGVTDRPTSAPAGGDTPTGAGIPFGHEDEPQQAHGSPTSPEYPVERQRK